MVYRVWREEYCIQTRISAIHDTPYTILPLLPAIRYTPYAIHLYETNISAEKEKALQSARVPQTICYHERQSPAYTQAQEGPYASFHIRALVA